MSVPHACMYGPGSFAMFMAGQLAESFIMSISGCAVLQSLLFGRELFNGLFENHTEHCMGIFS